jgi:hypothetical protein
MMRRLRLASETLVLLLAMAENVAAANDYDIKTFPIAGGNHRFNGINNHGQIVGCSATGGFLRRPDGSVVNIAVPNSEPGSTCPTAINDAGDIVGSFLNWENPDQPTQGFVTNIRASTYSTFAVPSGYSTSPEGINNKGLILGSFVRLTDSDSCRKGFLKVGASISVFNAEPVGSSCTSPGWTFAFDINSSGKIVGVFDSPPFHGFLRSVDGSNYEELRFPGAVNTFASGINDRSDVVGWYDTTAGTYAFLRSGGGEYSILNLPGIPLDINNKGEIVGVTADGQGFLATPVSGAK